MMDKESSSKLQELNNVQLKISFLFKDLLREKNDYKQKSENLSEKLEEICNEMQSLKNETESLKKQNEVLRLNIEDMKNAIERGIKIFKTLDLTQGCLFREQRVPLETLKTIFFECGKKLGNFQVIHEVRQKSEKMEKEFEGFSNLNFCTDFFCDEEPVKNSPKKDWVLKKSNSDTILKPLLTSAYDRPKRLKESASGCENETGDPELIATEVDANVFKSSQPSPEISQSESGFNRSPVFKDFGLRRSDSLSREVECNSKSFKSLPTKLINENLFEKSSDFMSPWKKSPGQAKEESPSKPKSAKRLLRINSPERSPLLKKSNTREAEISFSGVKKMRQTFLNVDCYKKKSVENRENENLDSKDEIKAYAEDDDFINESPKKAERVLEDVKNKKSGTKLKEDSFITPPQASANDLDETYISSSLIRKCNMKKQHELEMVFEEQTPLKRQAREKSPEYDSVPFAYKREPVRKKAERMKLPGHACAECNKYYEYAFDDIGSQDLKKILNKCSRHRDKNSPVLDDTPPGYWKPFLTCSTTISPNKNDTSRFIINPEEN